MSLPPLGTSAGKGKDGKVFITEGPDDGKPSYRGIYVTMVAVI